MGLSQNDLSGSNIDYCTRLHSVNDGVRVESDPQDLVGVARASTHEHGEARAHLAGDLPIDEDVGQRARPSRRAIAATRSAEDERPSCFAEARERGRRHAHLAPAETMRSGRVDDDVGDDLALGCIL
jgi:hypothetical protein